MRIGIVSAHYMPEVGYQEVHLAKAYARTGHTVKVFTSAATVKLGGNIDELKYSPGLSKDQQLGYEILRLPSFSYKSKVIPFGLKKAVKEFRPDVLVVLGVAKIFPLPLLSDSFNTIKKVSLYGDAKEYLERNTITQKFKAGLHDIGYAFIKNNLYKKALKHCDKLVMNIPETEEFFNDFLNENEKTVFNDKKELLYLGFDPDEYYYNEVDRNSIRKKLNIQDDEVVIITSTRVNRRKNLEKTISLFSKLNSEGQKVKYIIVGFLGDAYEKELKAFISAQPNPDAFICFPFLNSRDIRELYCAADAGIWLKVAISIQEAMGTGLPVILENKPSMNHLINENINGWFYEKNSFAQTIKKVTSLLGSQKTNRKQLAETNGARLSYNAIATKVLEMITK